MGRLLRGVVCLMLLAASYGCAGPGIFFTGEIREVIVEKSPRWFEPNRIALVDIEGFISLERGLWYLVDGVTVADVKEKLQRAEEDGSVRAIVLRINSPGGGVAASDVIYREVLRFKQKTRKPVVAMLMGVAASGAYYTALAADRIVALPTAVTGSVGVLVEYMNVEGLYRKVGLHSETFKSGDKKDIGSPTRAMTEAEREILQGIIGDLFERFVEVVRSGRPTMNEADLATISDGRILTADQALELHLIDRIGYLDEAISEARELAGIKTADVILYRAAPSYNANVYARAGGLGLITEGVATLLRRRGPAFLYLWAPGM